MKPADRSVVVVFCNVLLEPSMTFVSSRIIPVIKEMVAKHRLLTMGLSVPPATELPCWIQMMSFHDQQN